MPHSWAPVAGHIANHVTRSSLQAAASQQAAPQHAACNFSSWATLLHCLLQLEQALPLKQQHHHILLAGPHSSAPTARHTAAQAALTADAQQKPLLAEPSPLSAPGQQGPTDAPFTPDSTRARRRICLLAGPSPSAPMASHAAVDAALGHSGTLRLDWEHIMDQDLQATPVLDPVEAPAGQPPGNGAPEQQGSDHPSGSLGFPSLGQARRAPGQQHSSDPVGPQAHMSLGGGPTQLPPPSSGLPIGQGARQGVLDGPAQHPGASSRTPVSWGCAGQQQTSASEGGGDTQQHAPSSRLPVAQAYTAEQPSQTVPLDTQSSYPPRGLAMRSSQAPPASWPKIMPSWNAAVSVDPFQQVLDSSNSESQPQQKGQSL